MGSPNDDLEVLFLEQGAQAPEDVAAWFSRIIAAARHRIDLAIYDFHLHGEAAAIVVGALRERQQAGVEIRIVYNAPREAPGEGTVVDPGHPDETESFLRGADLPARSIGDVDGRPNLMHHKYLVVDAGSPGARIVTGSANLTDTAFSVQENNLVAIASPELAALYARNFDELWRSGDVAGSGAREGGFAVVRYAGEDARVEVRFAPGEGIAIDHAIAERVRAASRRVTIAAVSITSGRILGALAETAERGVPLSGIVDGTQMERMVAYWTGVPASAWKAEAFRALVRLGHLRGKRSSPGALHDFMHDKVIVVDDAVITGSYNFSHNAQDNAENILFVESRALAREYRDYIARLVRRYPAVALG